MDTFMIFKSTTRFIFKFLFKKKNGRHKIVSDKMPSLRIGFIYFYLSYIILSYITNISLYIYIYFFQFKSIGRSSLYEFNPRKPNLYYFRNVPHNVLPQSPPIHKHYLFRTHTDTISLITNSNQSHRWKTTKSWVETLLLLKTIKVMETRELRGNWRPLIGRDRKRIFIPFWKQQQKELSGILFLFLEEIGICHNDFSQTR